MRITDSVVIHSVLNTLWSSFVLRGDVRKNVETASTLLIHTDSSGTSDCTASNAKSDRWHTHHTVRISLPRYLCKSLHKPVFLPLFALSPSVVIPTRLSVCTAALSTHDLKGSRRPSAPPIKFTSCYTQEYCVDTDLVKWHITRGYKFRVDLLLVSTSINLDWVTKAVFQALGNLFHYLCSNDFSHFSVNQWISIVICRRQWLKRLELTIPSLWLKMLQNIIAVILWKWSRRPTTGA